MSTPRWKAKEVYRTEWNNKYKKYDKIWDGYETENGERFTRCRSDQNYSDKTQFYIVKPTGDHRGCEWRYWIYPIPTPTIRQYTWNGQVYYYISFSKGRRVVVKK